MRPTETDIRMGWQGLAGTGSQCFMETDKKFWRWMMGTATYGSYHPAGQLDMGKMGRF